MYCVTQLPELCSFQMVTYTITISLNGEPVFELTKNFSYSSGNRTDCVKISEKVLEEGTQYSVYVSVDAGESGNSYLNIPFSEFPFPDTILDQIYCSPLHQYLECMCMGINYHCLIHWLLCSRHCRSIFSSVRC